jgi:hypothetical protein
MTLALIRSATRLSGSTELAEVSSKSELAAFPAWVPDPASPDIWCRGRGRGRGDDFRVGCRVGAPCSPAVLAPVAAGPCPSVVKNSSSVSSVCSCRGPHFACSALGAVFPCLRSLRLLLWKIPVPIRADPCESVVMIRIKTGNGGDRFSCFFTHFSVVRGLISRRLRKNRGLFSHDGGKISRAGAGCSGRPTLTVCPQKLNWLR